MLKKKEPPFGRFTIEQIGRELREFYPARKKLPPDLRALARELERKVVRRRRKRQREDGGQTS
jgi:hypothetical protein